MLAGLAVREMPREFLSVDTLSPEVLALSDMENVHRVMSLPLIGSSIMCFFSCSALVGTPMHGFGDCRYLPTVEECQETAELHIEDWELRKCVILQCRDAKPLCHGVVKKRCIEASAQKPEGQRGGQANVGDETDPVPEFDWCSLPQSPYCQALTMIHELAHTCGWEHGDGKGVPGNKDGRLPCR